MSNVAYDARNILMIRFRKWLSEVYCNCGKQMKKMKKTPSKQFGLEKVLVYPEFKTEQDLSRFVNKLFWYLPRSVNSQLSLSLFYKKPIDLANFLDAGFKDQPNYFKKDFTHITVKQSLSDDDLTKADRILIHQASSLLNPRIWPYFDKVFMVDPNFYSTMESTGFGSLFQRTMSEAQIHELTQLSKNNFQRLLKYKQDKAFLFLSGPSINEAYKHDFSAGVKIICNSIIKDRDLMKHIQPDILVFADPVFHLGPSKYADKFRELMIEAVIEHDMSVVVPENYLPLLVTHYPVLTERIIGVKTLASTKFVFPAADNLAVKATDNILTLFMLPFASALSQEIYLIGSDGRQKSENYFWKHNERVQFNDLMETVFNTHPSFFRDRVYTDYYDHHCRLMEELMTYGESYGLKYFSLTYSYIPAVQKRFNQELIANNLNKTMDNEAG
jgi:hypothetical protein